MSNNALNLTINVNGREVENTMKAITKETYKLRAEVNKTTEGTEDWEKANRDLAVIEAERKRQIAAQKQYRDEITKTTDATEDNTAAMHDFGENANKVLSGIASGDLIGVQEGLRGIQTGIMGATKAAWAFIATPIGAALAVFAAAAASVKVIWDYNTAIGQLNEELRALGISAEEMDNVRSEVEAVAETYDKEFSEIARKAKGLSETFGISMSEALGEISRGLADGGKMNSEFMDSIGEYDVFFSEAGYSAQQFIDIVNQGFELGIYSDKLPDAIKEAGLSLQKQTTATRDALVNAFGATFTNDILSKIDKGEMTVRQGLEAIAAQAEKTGLTQQQQAQLTADIFRGAGEDAGGAMKVLEAISLSAQRELDATAKANEKLVDANTRLNKVQSQLFGISGFGELWVKIKTVSVNAISAILEQLNFLKTTGQFVATNVTNFFIGMANNGIMAVQKTIEAISPALKLMGADVEKIQKSLQSFKIEKVNFVSEIAPPAPPEMKEPDPINLSYGTNEGTVEKEALARAETEKKIREKVKSVMAEWEAEQAVGNENEDSLFQKSQNLAEEQLKILQEGKLEELKIHHTTEEEILKQKKKFAEEGYTLSRFFADQEKKINEQKVQWNQLSEEQKLQTVTGALSAASQAFNEGSAAWKAAKIAETTIATYQGAQNAFTALSGIPVVGPALGAAAAAAAVIAGLKQVQQISSTQIPKAPSPRRGSFARGGYTDGFGMGYTDETGHEVAGDVHVGEYVVPKIVRQDPEVPEILNYLEAKRKKKLGLYADGGDTVNEVAPVTTASSSGNRSREIELLEAILAAQGVTGDIYFGMEAEQKRQEQQKQLQAIQDRAKVKKS